MPRQQHNRATSASRQRASSAERNQRVSDDTTTTTTMDAEQQGRLRRVRSFTTRSGTVINRGDSYKVHGATGGDGEPSRRTRSARRDAAAVDCVPAQRSHSAATTSRHRLPRDYQNVTTICNDVTSTDTPYTVMVLGSPGVGKTTVTQQLLTSEYLANKDYNIGQSTGTMFCADCQTASTPGNYRQHYVTPKVSKYQRVFDVKGQLVNVLTRFVLMGFYSIVIQHSAIAISPILSLRLIQG